MTNYALPYRRDVDGLRAWAVALVVLFHADIPPFDQGGFVGVDVFFVISGYLITRVIAGEVERGNFSIAEFYARRVRRIIPALTVMMLATFAMAAVFVLPFNLERMAESGLAAMLFSSNIYFWRITSNYFAPSAELSPFLHTWSLSVEEQFYIVFPPLFALLFVRSQKLLRTVCLVVGLSTLVLCEYGNSIAPTANFFLAPSRAWEFLVGSLLALNAVPEVHRAWLASLLTALGLCLITTTAVVLSPDWGFPGLTALPPVLGAALVVHCGGGAVGPIRSLLTARPVVAAGLISYSLYLWHWPVLVLAEHYVLKRPLGGLGLTAALVVSVLLAWASYVFVETPFRRDQRFRARRPLFVAAASLSSVVLLVAVFFKVSAGLAWLYPDLALLSIKPQMNAEAPVRQATGRSCFLRELDGRKVNDCVLAEATRNAAGTLLIWGDSFAGHYMPALVNRSDVAGGARILSFVSNQCPPVLGYDPVNLRACKPINDAAFNRIVESKTDAVILAANWLSYVSVNRIDVDDIAATVHTLQERGVKVILVGQSPVFRFSEPVEPYYRHLKSGGPAGKAAAWNATPQGFNEVLRAATGADAFVDPTGPFCSRSSCLYHDERGYLFSDYGHLTLLGSRRVLPEFSRAIARLH